MKLAFPLYFSLSLPPSLPPSLMIRDLLLFSDSSVDSILSVDVLVHVLC